MAQERLAIIRRDNQILLKHMSEILLDEPLIDNYNDYKARSLNVEKRRQELVKITEDNHAMLKRIIAKQPNYSRHFHHTSWLVSCQLILLVSSGKLCVAHTSKFQFL